MYIIIVGCGRVGSKLAKLLAGAGHNVVVIDKEAGAFQYLGADFNGVTITGSGFDIDLLKEAGIEHADAVCTVTDSDNANIMSGQVAKKIFHIAKVITRINDIQYTHLYKELGIDVVNGTTLLASLIRNKIIESKYSSFFLEDSRIETIEIEVNGKISGKEVAEITIPGEFVVVAMLNKKRSLILVRPNDKLAEGDILYGVLKVESQAKVKRFLGVK